MRALSGFGMVILAVLAGMMAWNSLDVALGGPGAAARGLIPKVGAAPSTVPPPAPYQYPYPPDSFPAPVPVETETETFGQKVARATRHALVYEANGWLTILYFILDNAAVMAMLALAAAAAYVEREAPTAQRVFTGAALLASVMAGLAVPTPIPLITAAMWLFVPAVQVLDPAGGRSLAWRAKSGIFLYAGACVLYLVYTRLTFGISPEAWAALAGGVEEARAVMAQSRAYITTMANIALWFVLPLGYFSLMAQAVLAHPFPRAPFRSVAERIRLIRTRGME